MQKMFFFFSVEIETTFLFGVNLFTRINKKKYIKFNIFIRDNVIKNIIPGQFEYLCSFKTKGDTV